MRLMRHFVPWALVAGIAQAQQVCNNAAGLCSKSYGNITQLAAHDSPFVRNSSNAFTVAGDQFYGSVAALDAGVRMLTAQVYPYENDYHLCHTSCLLYDAGTLSSWLTGIKAWLDGNPNDVVTILLVNNNQLNASTLDGQFQRANIAQYAYTPPSNSRPLDPWPTLSDMIGQNKRLVTFIASGIPPSSNTNASTEYLLDEFTFAFENNYDNTSPSDFSCEVNRPSSLNGNTEAALGQGLLPIMNHFRYDNLSGIEIPAVEDVNTTNAQTGAAGSGNLGDTAQNCTTIWGRQPAFILVDFFNVANAIDTVDALNNVTGQTSGRTTLPDTVAASMANSTAPTPSDTATTGTSSASVTPSGPASSKENAAGTNRVPFVGAMICFLTFLVL